MYGTIRDAHLVIAAQVSRDRKRLGGKRSFRMLRKGHGGPDCLCAPKKHSSERTRPLFEEETPRQRHKRNVLLPSRRFALVAWSYAVTPSLMCAPGAEKRAVVLTTSSWGRRGEDPSWQMRFPCFHDLPSPLNPASNIGVIYQAVGPFRTRDWSAKTNTTLRSHRRLLPPNGTGAFKAAAAAALRRRPGGFPARLDRCGGKPRSRYQGYSRAPSLRRRVLATFEEGLEDIRGQIHISNGRVRFLHAMLQPDNRKTSSVCPLVLSRRLCGRCILFLVFSMTFNAWDNYR